MAEVRIRDHRWPQMTSRKSKAQNALERKGECSESLGLRQKRFLSSPLVLVAHRRKLNADGHLRFWVLLETRRL